MVSSPKNLSAAERAVEPQWTPALMIQLKRVGVVQVSPDATRTAFTVRETVLANDRSEYLTHIFLANHDGSVVHQLTRGEKSCEDPQWSPDGGRIAFVSSRIGKKNLWLIDPDGGEAIQLSGSKTDVTSFKWSPDGKGIAYTAVDATTADDEQRTREKSDVRVVDQNVKLNRLFVTSSIPADKGTSEARLLNPGDTHSIFADGVRAGRASFDWSPDSRQIAFSHSRTPTADDWPTADLSIVEVATGAIQSLVKSGAAEISPLYSPDGKTVAFVASDDPPTWGGWRTICLVSTADGSFKKLPETRDGFGRYSELVGWSADGAKLLFTEVQGTTLRFMAMSLNGLPVELRRADGMSLAGVFLNSRRTHLGFSWEQLGQPSEAFISRVDEIAPKQLSQVHIHSPKPPLGKTEVIRWKSTDGLQIEGLLTYPVDYQKGQRYPLLVVIHGGPMGVYTQTFDGTPTQYPVAAFAARGYAVLRPNPRGSSGNGQKFRYANYRDWGGGDFDDIMQGIDHVIGQGIADTDRLGVMGWSYGGYMTSWIITQSHRFKAASVGAGVTNLMSFTGTADIPGFLPDYLGGEFWDNLDLYRARSPMFQIKGVKTPTLIQHGERDERVPLSQGQELYNALKRQGCITKMVIYPRTPHAVEEPRLLLDCMERNLEWFQRYVPTSTPTDHGRGPR